MKLLNDALAIANTLALDGVPFGLAFTEATRLLAGTPFMVADPAAAGPVLTFPTGLKGVSS
jgi:hypothetical protein